MAAKQTEEVQSHLKTASTSEEICENPKCRQPFLSYGKGFHELGNGACSFYSTDEKFCCSSCETEYSENSFGTINLNEFHSLGTLSVVPTNENKDETLTQSNLGEEILVIQSNRSQEPTKVPSNHSAKDPQKTCLESPANQSQKWTKPEVQQLLILYKANEEKFRDPKWKKKSIWKEISKEMNQHDYSYSALKCEVKFKNLKQKYVKTVDHNNKSGNSFKTCSFFDELNEIFACNPSVEPVAECSNRKGYTKAVDNEETAAENIHSIDDMCTPQKTSDQKKGKPEKRRFSVTESLANIREDLKKENEQKIQKMEEMHKEKMQRFDRLLNLYERDLSLNNK